MMLPLWTRVTEGWSLSIAYWMAALTRRVVPSWLTGLMPMPAVSGKRNLLEALGERLGEELLELLAVVGAVLELDAGVDVFGVLAEDDHVGLFGVLDRAGDALEVAHGAQAGVEVEDLPQGDVERADAAAGGVVSGPLMPTRYSRSASSVASGSQSPVASNAFSPAAPPSRRSALAAVGLFDHGVEDELGGGQMSGPVPSPSMKGMMGMIGTR
jgi:hypothetical protein